MDEFFDLEHRNVNDNSVAGEIHMEHQPTSSSIPASTVEHLAEEFKGIITTRNLYSYSAIDPPFSPTDPRAIKEVLPIGIVREDEHQTCFLISTIVLLSRCFPLNNVLVGEYQKGNGNNLGKLLMEYNNNDLNPYHRLYVESLKNVNEEEEENIPNGDYGAWNNLGIAFTVSYNSIRGITKKSLQHWYEHQLSVNELVRFIIKAIPASTKP